MPQPVLEGLIEKLKKPFKKAFKNLNVVYDWKSFAEKAKAMGIDNLDMQRMVMAFHGSPHTFDRFSTEFMGAGEGAQAFGWGLYFTDLKGIAEGYAKNLADYKIKINSKELNLNSPLHSYKEFIIKNEGNNEKNIKRIKRTSRAR